MNLLDKFVCQYFTDTPNELYMHTASVGSSYALNIQFQSPYTIYSVPSVDAEMMSSVMDGWHKHCLSWESAGFFRVSQDVINMNKCVQ